jgi:hypothetical protein
MPDFTLRIAPLGYQQLSVGSTTASNLTVPGGAIAGSISVESQAVRFRDDGTAPTSSVGFPIAVTSNGPPFDYAGNLGAVQMIAETGTATVNILYYKIVG